MIQSAQYKLGNFETPKKPGPETKGQIVDVPNSLSASGKGSPMSKLLIEKYGEVTLLTLNRPAPEAECARCREQPTEIERANSACARLILCFTQR